MSNPFKHPNQIVAKPLEVPSVDELRKKVFQQGKAMRATLKKLKQKPPRDLDEQFEKLHNQAFKKNRLLELWQLLQNHLADVV